MIAMAGMFLAGHAVFVSFAVGTMLVVAAAVAGSLTFLPAMLSWLADRGWLEKGRVPYVARLRRRTRDRSRAWAWILDRVLRRPAPFAAAAVVVLVALALPGLGMKTIDASQAMPKDLPVTRTYERIQAAFPGGAVPALVVVEARDVTSPQVAGAIRALKERARGTGLMSGAIGVAVNPSRTVATVSVPLHGNGTDAASERALQALRHDVVPATVGAVAGVRANVTGLTAGSKDFNDAMRSHLPLVFAFVLGLAFLLLLVSFRSLVVPIKAIVLNLLSVGAAYGVLKLIFQDGRLEGPLHYQSAGGVAAWLPLFLFVILFGLSMDYHVFILSRIREAVERGRPTDAAVAEGIQSTAGVVTSAAVVMVAVFSLFATFSSLEIKQMGVGLAVAVLIDATLVRAILLPATMKLLGEWNWYLPRRLHWLPRRRVMAGA
jgi:RND superfamily putative drug exporter